MHNITYAEPQSTITRKEDRLTVLNQKEKLGNRSGNNSEEWFSLYTDLDRELKPSSATWPWGKAHNGSDD
jgi:hypothetical protein